MGRPPDSWEVTQMKKLKAMQGAWLSAEKDFNKKLDAANEKGGGLDVDAAPSIQARCMEKMDKRRRKKVGRSRGRSRDDCAQPVARSTRGDAATTCSPVIPCARAFALTVCCGTLCSMRSNSLRNRRNVSTAAWYDKIAHPSLRHDSPLHIQSIRKSLHGVGRSY